MDTEGYLRNPAGRLYMFLKYIREHGVPNGPMLNVVTDYMELPAQFTPTLFVALADLQSQPELMRAQVNGLVNPPLPAHILLEELPAAEAAINAIVPSLHNQIQGARDQYNDGTLKSLQHASHILNGATGFRAPVADDQLDEVKAQAEALISILAEDASIDAELRRVLFAYADGVRRSVDVYKISGLDGVLAEFDRFIGVFRRQPQMVAEVVKKPKVAEKMQALLLALNIVAGAGNAAVAIDSGISVFQELTAIPTSTVAHGQAGAASEGV